MLKSNDFVRLCEEIAYFLKNKVLLSIEGLDNRFTCFFENAPFSLFISTQPHLATFFLTDQTRKNTTAHPLTKFLHDTKLTDIHYHPKGYVLCLKFEKDHLENNLWIKCTQTTANWMLTDHNNHLVVIEYAQCPIRMIVTEKTIHIPPLEQIPYSNFIKNRYLLQQKEKSLEEEKKELLKYGKQKLASSQNSLNKIELQMEKAGRWKKEKEKADLLKAHFHLLLPRLTQVQVANFYDNNSLTTILLNPKLSAESNIKWYYTKSKKMQKSQEHLIRMKTFYENKIEEWRYFLSKVIDTSNFLDLQHLKKKYFPEKSNSAVKPICSKKKGYRSFKSEKGDDIYIGISEKGNEYLSFHIAHGNDWWFHAKDYPGSHVVLRLLFSQSDHDILQSMEDAALMAAFHSKAKYFSKVAIVFTQCKHLKNLNKGKVGIAKSKTKTISLDEKKLKKLLDH